MPPDAAFSCTKFAGLAIATKRTICILVICLTTRMHLSTRSAQPWISLYLVRMTIAYSWARGRNTHCWVFLHLFEMVNIAFLAGWHYWNWRIWFSGVQPKYMTGKERICPWKVLSRSFSSLCVFCTQMSWASDMILLLALVYSTLQWSPRRSTEVLFWNGWR